MRFYFCKNHFNSEKFVTAKIRIWGWQIWLTHVQIDLRSCRMELCIGLFSQRMNAISQDRCFAVSRHKFHYSLTLTWTKSTPFIYYQLRLMSKLQWFCMHCSYYSSFFFFIHKTILIVLIEKNFFVRQVNAYNYTSVRLCKRLHNVWAPLMVFQTDEW